MSILHLDFETRSACDLKSEGLARYAEDPTTGVHCMAFALDDQHVGIFYASDFPHVHGTEIFEHVRSGGLVYAHNAAFELAIWNQVCVPKYGWPELKPEQCRCTMAMAYAMGLPGSLEAAAPALGVEVRKDTVGKRVMLKWCQPKKDGTFWKPADDPQQFEALCDYCRQDVEVERAIHHRMMELSPAEQELWALDYRINQTGILVDLPAIDKAIKLVCLEKARLDKEMLRVTGGVVGSCSEVQLMVKWIRSQGVEIKGVAKSDVIDALAEADVPPAVRQALKIRQEAAKSSTAKLVAMRDRACKDGRVRGIHQYHGAGTGRWAGRGVQTQNLARPRPDMGPDEIEDVIQHLGDRPYVDSMYGPVLDALSDCLRGMIVAPDGSRLIVADWSNIEGRVGAWLTGEDWKIKAFHDFDAGKGPDIYKLAYARSFNKPVSEVQKDERTIGKVMELALQYGGGPGAFQSMAKNYGVKVTDGRADELKTLWRKAHPAIVRYWYAVETAAIESLTSAGPVKVGPAGRQVAFKKSGSFLWCKLPSGRVLCYPYAEIQGVRAPWMDLGEFKDSLTYMTMMDPNIKSAKTIPDPNASGKWQRVSTYSGKLFENLCQAVARDILAEGMKRLDSAGYHITFHVHDEIITEMPEDTGSLKEVERILCAVPAWAEGLPIAVEGFESKRYRK